VLHAIADALLGAAGLDDLGTLFPDRIRAGRARRAASSSPRSSRASRRTACRVVNVDVVIATEGPRIAPHRAAMRQSIAGLLGVERGRST
jgi:2-C-methyl-D-erythritol 2,4-cyclodiphosphate synthase